MNEYLCHMKNALHAAYYGQTDGALLLVIQHYSSVKLPEICFSPEQSKRKLRIDHGFVEIVNQQLMKTQDEMMKEGMIVNNNIRDRKKEERKHLERKEKLKAAKLESEQRLKEIEEANKKVEEVIKEVGS